MDWITLLLVLATAFSALMTIAAAIYAARKSRALERERQEFETALHNAAAEHQAQMKREKAEYIRRLEHERELHRQRLAEFAELREGARAAIPHLQAFQGVIEGAAGVSNVDILYRMRSAIQDLLAFDALVKGHRGKLNPRHYVELRSYVDLMTLALLEMNKQENQRAQPEYEARMATFGRLIRTMQSRILWLLRAHQHDRPNAGTEDYAGLLRDVREELRRSDVTARRRRR